MYASQGQNITITVDTPSWYAWLETAMTFTFTCEEGTFTAHKMRAGNQRGGWYWRAYRRKLGRLSNYYLGICANVTLPRLHEAARHLAIRSEGRAPGKETAEQELLSQISALSDVLTPTPPLTIKFAIPRLPISSVSRPHLLTLLEQSVQKSLTLVSAPAGSGKTTLLAQWATTTTFPVVWLSLEAAENDPTRFLSCLIATLARLNERLGTPVQIDQLARAHAFEQVLTTLLNSLQRGLRQDTVLILDDYHLITTDAVHTMLHFLLNHLPLHLHLIIGARVDPTLPLARLRAQGQLNELSPQELRFTREEVEAFARAMGLTLSDEATSLLEERTEGWIAGIQLLTLALCGQGDTHAEAFLRAFRGHHRFLLDYVSEEILAQQPPETQHFLLRTCVLERLTGPLCDVVTGESGGSMRLAALCRANLFVSALDDAGTWYRYHSLFAEALRACLQQQEPEQIPELYRRASHWYEEQHWLEEACDYAYLSGDLPRAATLVEILVPHLIEQGKFLQMRQWLSQLSPTFIAASPLLSLVSMWTQMFHKNGLFRREQSLRILIEHLNRQIQAQAQHAEASGAALLDALPLLRAMVALGKGDGFRTLLPPRDLLPARTQPESAVSQIIAASRRILMGAAYRANGKLDAAEQALLLVDRTGSLRTASPLDLFAFFSLADLYEAQGQLHKVGQCYDDLFEVLAGRSASSPFLLAQAQVRFAALLYEWNHLREAERTVEQGMKLAERLDLPIPGISLLGVLTQVRIAWAKGDREQAKQLLSLKEADPDTFPIPTFAKTALSAFPARLALICHLPEQAERWLARGRFRFDDQLVPGLTSSDYFGYATLARFLIARGRLHRTPEALTQALILLDQLRSTAVQMGCTGWSIEIQMLTALTQQAQGKIKAALTQLGATLAEAELEGYVRLFADEGEVMAHLLTHISPYTNASPGYLQLLQTAMPPSVVALPTSPQAIRQPPLLEPLSTREQDVLHLLAAGFSNQQIARRLVISLHTVKLHVKHILAKLTAINRTQAVARARELHLLSPE